MVEVQQEVKQGSAGQLTSDLILSSVGASGRVTVQMEHQPKVPPQVEDGLA